MLLLAFNVADRCSSFKFGTGIQRKTVVSVTFNRYVNNTLLFNIIVLRIILLKKKVES